MTEQKPTLDLIFLGTGGGRFATITQRRRTAGIRILYEKANLHLDPGPGALVYSLKAGLNPQRLNGLLISHCHPDHYNDAEVLIEAMTTGMTKKRGVLAAAHSVLYGNDHCEPSISKYHQQMPQQLIDAQPGTEFNIQNLRVSATRAKHTDPNAVGFKIATPTLGHIAYTSDSEYFTGIGTQYSGTRILILCVLRPTGSPWKGHMTTNDAIKIVEEARPEMTVLTHFGMQMLVKDPDKEAQSMQQQTEVPTIAAKDEMHVKIGEKIKIQTQEKNKALEDFF